MAKLTGRVAIVTGGASGIGKAIVEEFVSEGAKVVIADFNMAGADELAATLKDQGADVLAIRANVAESASVQAMVKATLQAYGQIDVLVNNAGIGEPPGPIHEKDEQAWARVLAVNATGPFLCMKYVIQDMLKRKQGAIINMASIGGLLGFANSAAYAASKGAIIQLTRAAAIEYAQQGIRVNAIAPGWVSTPMVDAFIQSGVSAARLIRATPIGRIGTPEEIAKAAAFLASDESSYFQGAVLVADGGLSIA